MHALQDMPLAFLTYVIEFILEKNVPIPSVSVLKSDEGVVVLGIKKMKNNTLLMPYAIVVAPYIADASMPLPTLMLLSQMSFYYRLLCTIPRRNKRNKFRVCIKWVRALISNRCSFSLRSSAL